MASITPSNVGLHSIPEILHDVSGQKMYQRGQFLGKVPFAEFYELTDISSGQVFGGKIFSKQLLLLDPVFKNHVNQEVTTHRGLKHEHIVGFNSVFEDDNFVCVVLELCQKQSLMQLHLQRRAVTEPEARYFMHQLLLGVKYLHKNKMIHRHLRLENLFLNDNMVLKIGDFGWVAKPNLRAKQIRTLCGTSEHSAPELFGLKGHSFPVDVYSMGSILYTLLVGSPPFVVEKPEELHIKILKNEYIIPNNIGPLARTLIHRMLQGDPKRRPTVDAVLKDTFMTSGSMPARLPLSCLTTAPLSDAQLNTADVAVARRPLGDLNRENPLVAAFRQLEVKDDAVVSPRELNKVVAAIVYAPGSSSPKTLFQVLQQQLMLLFAANPKISTMMNQAEDPAAAPMVWISKWVDHSDKYGFGYRLSDDTIGVLFRDRTKILLLVDGKTIQYVDRDGSELQYPLDQHPAELIKKVKLLIFFWRSSLLDGNLIPSGSSVVQRNGDEHLRSSFLLNWFRASLAVVMHMSTGTLQMNYIKDHVKLILCPDKGAVTVIDEQKKFRTFKFSLLAEHGCSVDLLTRLQYAHEQLSILQASDAAMQENK